jgi:putative transferase (TIGR04331 family)
MFLTTTAIEQFWDKSQKILFLGEWCKLYSRRNEWMSLEYEDIPFVWKNTEIIANGIEHCNEVYEKTLIELTTILNEYHDIDKDVTYYRHIIGIWILDFIHQIYDKYITIKKAFEIYPDVKTWVLDEEQLYIPVDYTDYTKYRNSDEYALQFYTQVLKVLGYNFDSKRLSRPIEQKRSYHINHSEKPKIRRLYAQVLSFFANGLYNKKTVTITAPYFKYNKLKNTLSLLFKSYFRCIIDDMSYEVNINFDIDHVFRKKTLNMNSNEFESLLSEILISNIPALYLEGFNDFRRSVMLMPIHKSDAFFTANALHRNNIYKLFLAEHFQTIKILNMQCGGGYGMDYVYPAEEYEKSIVDRFYSMGRKSGTKVTPLPLPLITKKTSYNRAMSDKILFVMYETPRYVYRLHFKEMSTNILRESLAHTMIFLKYILKRDKLLIRTTNSRSQYGWGLSERIADHYKDCLFDDPDKSFYPVLKESKMFLSNAAHTTFLEALAINKPTVVFLSKNIYRFNSEALTYFNSLQKVGILHYSPESAAEHINAVYDNIDSWWLNEEVQRVRESYVLKYALHDSNWAKEWIKEFNRVINE